MRQTFEVPVMRYLLAVSVAFAAMFAAGCASGSAVTPAAPSPAFDTIAIDVTGGANPAVITYDLRNGLANDSKTYQVAQRTPFHFEQTTPHDSTQRAVGVKAFTFAFQGAPPFNCTIKVNGKTVAANVESEPGGGATCTWSGLPA